LGWGDQTVSERKRVFTALMGFSLLLLLLSFWLLLLLSYGGFKEIHPLLPPILAIGLSVLSALCALLVLLLLVSLRSGRIPPWEERTLHLFIRILSSPTLLLGRLLGIPKDRIERSFKVKNCRSCGRCNVSELLAIAESCGVRLRVASGGTSARRFISEYQPEAVIAVACERDLSSGIRESFSLPVIGIVNERPYGYCLNTRVDLGRVREAIRLLTGREREGKD